MKIYTRKGDKGNTYCGNEVISKSSAIVDVVGELDELNSLIGMCKSYVKKKENHIVLESIQSDLFKIGAEIGYPSSKISLSDNKVKVIERIIDSLNEDLPKLNDFILPGGSYLASGMHLCRSVCRRVERKIVKLNETVIIREIVLSYINRLSDLFFIYARYFSNGDRIWKKDLEIIVGVK